MHNDRSDYHANISLAIIAAVIVVALSIDDANIQTQFADLPRGTQVGLAMELPPELRTQNYSGGSCVHASTINLLIWQGQEDLAKWWRENYSGGEYSDRLLRRMESANLRYAYTTSGDEKFLEWCVRTRRGAGIFWKTKHAINVVGMDDQYVYVLDNNYVDYPEDQGHYERYERSYFLNEWRNRFGGFSFTLVYVPPPPTPFL